MQRCAQRCRVSRLRSQSIWPASRSSGMLGSGNTRGSSSVALCEASAGCRARRSPPGSRSARRSRDGARCAHARSAKAHAQAELRRRVERPAPLQARLLEPSARRRSSMASELRRQRQRAGEVAQRVELDSARCDRAAGLRAPDDLEVCLRDFGPVLRQREPPAGKLDSVASTARPCTRPCTEASSSGESSSARLMRKPARATSAVSAASLPALDGGPDAQRTWPSRTLKG